MNERELVETLSLSAPVSLAAILKGPAADVSLVVANLRAELAELLNREPNNYTALVLLGELDLRIGLVDAAQELLYRATLLKPPSWEAYQRTGLLLRRAEEDRAHRVGRVGGAPPPLWLRRKVVGLADRVKRLGSKPRNLKQEVTV